MYELIALRPSDPHGVIHSDLMKIVTGKNRPFLSRIPLFFCHQVLPPRPPLGAGGGWVGELGEQGPAGETGPLVAVKDAVLGIRDGEPVQDGRRDVQKAHQ